MFSSCSQAMVACTGGAAATTSPVPRLAPAAKRWALAQQALLQQLRASQVSLLQPRAGCLHGRCCTPNLTLWQTETTSPKHAPRLPTQSASRQRWLITKHDGAGRVELPLARICSAQRVHGIGTSAVIAPLPARASPRICSASRAARTKFQWLRAGSETCRTDMYTSDRTADVMRPAGPRPRKRYAALARCNSGYAASSSRTCPRNHPCVEALPKDKLPLQGGRFMACKRN